MNGVSKMRENALQQGQHKNLFLDLHDSIQQQIFALTMQVGVLKLLLNQNSDAALKNLQKIEHSEAALKSLQKIEHLAQLVQLDLNTLRSNLR